MKYSPISPQLYEYMLDKSLREHPVLKKLREKNNTIQLGDMQVPAEQAQFLQFLIRLTKAKNILELGTFTGYSSLAMALALPDDGQLITCDINSEWTATAQEFWQEAQQAHKIKLCLGPALETLNSLIKSETRQFDFIFIDADKANYPNYYELALKLINVHGLIAIDNVLWKGKVIDNMEDGSQTKGIRRLNELIKGDKRVNISLLPIVDGLFLIQLKLGIHKDKSMACSNPK